MHVFHITLAVISAIVAPTSAQTNYNYEEIESELSTTWYDQPVTFQATFTNFWTGARHPYQYPSNAHWSPVVFASHNKAYSMWCSNCNATNGVEVVAETGNASPLQNELDTKQAQKLVLDQKTSSSLPSPLSQGDEASVNNLCTDSDHPLVSAITMIAPSPDWISGLYNLPLWTARPNGNEVWYEKLKLYVFAWDAGTEEGSTYSTGNPNTNPKEGMKPFKVTADSTEDTVFVSETGNGDLQILPVGMITFELQGETSTCTALSSANTLATGVGSSSFFIRRKGQIVSTTCSQYLRRNPRRKRRRCKRRVYNANGEKAGTRVRDMCQETCNNLPLV